MKIITTSLSVPVAFTIALLASGCDGGGLLVVSTSPSTVTTLMGTTWAATSVDGVAADEPLDATITFESDQRVSGWSGCNRFGGSMSWDHGMDGMVRIGGGVSPQTDHVCDPGTMRREGRFMNALKFVRTRTMDGSRLRFLDGSTRTIVVFQKL